MRTLLPYQERAWDYVSSRDRIALFMKMRLGKSIITIRWAQHRLPQDASILVVAPLSVLPGWIDELKLEGEAGTILLGTSRQKMRVLDNCPTRWVLVNPEGLRACPAIATSIAWDCVILDESTFITNPKSKITKIVRKEFRHVRCKAVLAGEPAPESDLDFFEQMAFLHDRFLGCGTYYQFRHRYFYRLGWEWEPRKLGFKKQLREEVRRLGFVLSAHEAGVKYNRIYQRRYVRLSPECQRRYREARRSFSVDEAETKWAIVVAGWLTRLAGGCTADSKDKLSKPFSTHKIDELDYLACERFSGESLVVWFRYTDEIRFCRERLEARGVSLRCIDGSTPLVLRHAYRKAFQAGRIRVMLVQAKCARFGLDLSKSNIAIYYSNWWNWLTRAQSEARLEHPTKVGATLLYIDLVTERTYDEAVLDVLKDKKLNSRYFLRKVLVKHAQRERRPRSEDDGPLRLRSKRKNRSRGLH